MHSRICEVTMKLCRNYRNQPANPLCSNRRALPTHNNRCSQSPTRTPSCKSGAASPVVGARYAATGDIHARTVSKQALNASFLQDARLESHGAHQKATFSIACAGLKVLWRVWEPQQWQIDRMPPAPPFRNTRKVLHQQFRSLRRQTVTAGQGKRVCASRLDGW